MLFYPRGGSRGKSTGFQYFALQASHCFRPLRYCRQSWVEYEAMQSTVKQHIRQAPTRIRDQ